MMLALQKRSSPTRVDVLADPNLIFDVGHNCAQAQGRGQRAAGIRARFARGDPGGVSDASSFFLWVGFFVELLGMTVVRRAAACGGV